MDTYRGVLETALQLDVRKKGKYALLSALIPKMQIGAFLSASPTLFSSIMVAFVETPVSKAASNCLMCFVKKLKCEYPSQWLHHTWMSLLTESLRQGNERQRINLITYVIPPLIRLDNEMFQHILKALLPSDSETGWSDRWCGCNLS